MAAAEKETPSVADGLEWRVRVAGSDGSPAKVEVIESSCFVKAWRWLIAYLLTVVISKASCFVEKALKIGYDDPRKVIHGGKVGIALTFVSLFYYTRPLYDGLGGSAMWAVMTVVVAFEYTVGASLYKGINRAIGTLSAGSLAVGIHWIASKSGARFEPVILSAAVFILAAAATFSRFIPTLKARFDYGILIFILTFSLVAVSGYRVEELLVLAEQRMSTIAVGVCICLILCILICPVWAGEELHNLMCSNMEKLAHSLEDGVRDYFVKDESPEGKEISSSSKMSEGYKCILNSKASEDSQANLARWEPGHGRFGFRHPWNQYLKVGAAMRCCAYCLEALNGCINSEIQVPENMKKHLRDVCLRVSLDSSKLLKELASSMKSMTKSGSIRILTEDMKNAVEELKNALRSLPKKMLTQILEASDDEKKKCSTAAATATAPVALMEAVPLIAAASLLIEIAERIEGVAGAVDKLATLACFEQKPSNEGDKPSSRITPLMGREEALQRVEEV